MIYFVLQEPCDIANSKSGQMIIDFIEIAAYNA